jgi:polysaccharide biosynthesis protein PslH
MTRYVPHVPWPFRDLLIWARLVALKRNDAPDLIQIENSQLALLGLLTRTIGKPLIYEAHVVESEFSRGRERSSRKDKLIANLLDLGESVLIKIADRTIALSESDRNRLIARHKLAAPAVRVFPLLARPQDFSPPNSAIPTSQHSVVFLGSYTHEANRAAIQFIVNELRPALHNLVPSAEIMLVGKGIPKEIADHHTIRVFADVPDVRPLIDRAHVCIAPIWMGSGLRTKIIEYWTRSKPVVATDIAAEGLAARDGINIRIANTPVEFAHAIASIMREPDLGMQLGKEGLKTARLHFAEERVVGDLMKFYEEVRTHNRSKPS